MSTIRWSKATTMRERESKREERKKKMKSMFETNQSHIGV